MKKPLLILGFLLPVTAAFGRGNHLVNLLNSFNQRGVETRAPVSCDERVSKELLALTCARDLCGDAKSAPSAILDDRSIPGLVDEAQFARILPLEPKLKAIIARERAEETRLVAAWSERLVKGERLSLGGLEESKRSLLFNNFLRRHLSVDIDQEKPLQERITVELVAADFLSEDARERVQDFIPEFLQRQTQSFGSACYLGVYTRAELAAELKRRAELLRSGLTELRSKPMPQFGPDLEKLSADLELAAAGTFDTTERACELAFSLTSIDTSVAAYLQRDSLLSDRFEGECTGPRCLAALESFVNELDWKKLVADLDRGLKDPKLEEKQLAFCRSRMAELTLLDADDRFIREAIPAVKENFLQRSLAAYSSGSREKVRRYFSERLNFATKTAPSYSSADEFVQGIKDSADSVSHPADFSDLSTLLARSAISVSPELMTATPLAQGACPTGASYTIWDSFWREENFEAEQMPADAVAGRDNILISHFSCTHPSLGTGILAHELGHAFSITAAKDPLSGESMRQFAKDRACVGSWEDETPLPAGDRRASHPGDKLRSEEDMADLLSYRAFPESQELFSCALIGRSFDGLAYEGASLVNPMSLDSHSSGLTRTLREAIHKRLPLSSACQDLLHTEPSVRFHSCL